ncbi:MAG: zinc ABC transporter substrate-binding protein [Nanoarchaeota archaeon]
MKLYPLFVGLLLLVACTTPLSGKTTIITTTFPLYEFASEVAGDHADVILILPKQSDPHSFDPTINDLTLIANADLFIYTDIQLEEWTQDVLPTLETDLKMIQASDVLEEDEKREGDPHIWLDPRIDQRIVTKIADALSQIDKRHTDDYTKNAESYNEQLGILQTKLSSSLNNCLSKKLVVAGHASFAYLVEPYKIGQIAAISPSDEAELLPETLLTLISLTRESDVKSIFYQKGKSTDIAKIIVEETGASMYPLDTGVSQGEQSFLMVMEENRQNLIQGLQCSP